MLKAQIKPGTEYAFREQRSSRTSVWRIVTRADFTAKPSLRE